MPTEKLQRVCFVLQVKKEHIEEYKRRHKEVWPKLLDGFRGTGWHNYSLFLRGDGLLIGYVEAKNFKSSLAEMTKKDINHRWQMEMREFFEDPERRAADRQISPLEEIFHLN